MRKLGKIYVFVLLALLAISSCDDDMTMVGTTIQPAEDLITVYADTFLIKATTQRLDSIYARSSTMTLGEIYDPMFGFQKSDFMCQFYCEDGFHFAYTPVNNVIDSVKLFMFYNRNSWVGDSITPMTASVYKLTSVLGDNFYSNINPDKFCNKENLWGSITYTARSYTVSDSIWSDASYYPRLVVDLDKSVGQKIYDESVKNPSSFVNQASFNRFFPGIYVTNTYGSGCMMNFFEVEMYIYYNATIKASNGSDSTVLRYDVFPVTSEVYQLNRFKNNGIDKLLTDNDSCTFIKAPAGVYTQILVPSTQISKTLDVADRFVNNFTLNLHYLPADEWDYAYNPPAYLLLLPEDSVREFFENGNIENSETSFLSHNGSGLSACSDIGYNSTKRMYYFGNISSLLKIHIKKSPDKDLRLAVLPVEREYGDASGSSYYYNNSSSFYTTSISSASNPSGVKIRKDEDYMKVVVLSSKFENK